MSPPDERSADGRAGLNRPASTTGRSDDRSADGRGGSNRPAKATGRHRVRCGDFAARPPQDAEDRNWRVLDPRRDEDDAAEEEE